MLKMSTVESWADWGDPGTLFVTAFGAVTISAQAKILYSASLRGSGSRISPELLGGGFLWFQNAHTKVGSGRSGRKPVCL